MIWEIIEESTFDKHFSNPGLTIEELLVDENILTEMQNLNPQLLQFIQKNKDDIFTRLVKYVTEMPKQEEGYDRCHRLPYVSSEMLAIDNQLIYETFFSAEDKQNTKHLNQLFKFLESEYVDNELLLGYFEKVVNNLYKGRKLQFTKAVASNLELFSKNLDKETIGNILKNCVILLDTKQGVLYDQRKEIVANLITYLVQPKVKPKETRDICGGVLVQIIGRHRTYSSGEQLLKYILNINGELLIAYTNIQSPEICRFFIGVLNKSTQKIYNPQLDDKISIFSIPQQHKTLLQNYISLKLNYCEKLIQTYHAAPKILHQQDGSSVIKLHKQVLDFLTLVAITLENQIDQFLIQDWNVLNFCWQCMRQHPKNDIAIVQIDKIFLYLISDRSKNKDKLHQILTEKFGIVEHFCEIFRNQKQQKLLRPHLFELWNKLQIWISKDLQSSNKQWSNICKTYQQLIPLHTKAIGLNYHRPTNKKIVVDEQDTTADMKTKVVQIRQGIVSTIAPWSQNNDNQFERDLFAHRPKQDNETNAEYNNYHGQFKDKADKQIINKNEAKKGIFDKFQSFNDFNKQQQNKEQKKFADFSQFTL